MFEFTASARLRRSPYHNATLAAGVSSFTTYNRMLLPTGFGDPEAEYWRLVNDVSMWDVAVERQIEIKGPDAARLTQVLSPRRLDKCVVGQGKYVPICNHRGTIINDPIVLKLADDRYWLSIADSDILFWSRAIAAERNLQVDICEADVSPLAVQGPKADDVVAAIFGDWVRDLKYFWFRDATVNGIPLMVARSGWSKQGGYELYLMDGSRGTELWDIVREAGEPFNIGPGNPNACERIESGLLSWGGDTDEQTNPYEIRMGNFVDLDVDDDVVGIKALRAIHAEGPKRHQLGVILDGSTPHAPHEIWYDIMVGDEKIGSMTNGVWSRRMKRNIGFALVNRAYTVGDWVSVMRDGQAVPGALVKLPFM